LLSSSEEEVEIEEDKAHDRRRRNKLKRLLDDEEMKFSHSIQFNAVPDWSSHYIAYSNLKKVFVAAFFLTIIC
jgi:hypothetical protein